MRDCLGFEMAYAYGSPAPYSYVLCQGDQVDQQLKRDTVYLSPREGDSSCTPVALVPINA